jgi:Leucine-rich repeat (LRR) protein
MRYLSFVIWLTLSLTSWSQDSLIIFRSKNLPLSERTSAIDSLTFPDHLTFRIHFRTDSVADILLTEIDSLKMIPDKKTADTDRQALTAFFNATGGTGWANKTNWCSDAPLNQWYGVNTDSLGRVTHIELVSNQLSGYLPPETGQLTQLKRLNLAVNQLSGIIPPEIGNLTLLQSLQLQANQITGNLPPELSRLVNLEDLYLFGNKISGNIPPEMGRMVHLETLMLDSNPLSGSIPSSFGKLSRLEHLSMNATGISGSIPAQLGNLKNLKQLHLWRNKLTGTIPPELGNLSELDWLHLANNELTGTIPAELGKLSKLRFLSIDDNKLEGNLPASLGQLESLETLNLSQNQLTGTIPAGFRDLSNLINLSLVLNKLSGPIPGVLAELTGLEYLNLSGNQFDGPIPKEMGNLKNLRVFRLSTNSLTGHIPPEIGRLTSLKDLMLNSNFLTGAIPPEFGQLTQLELLDLSCNQLADDIPAELGQLTNLKKIDLSFNHYIGELPSEISALYSLPNLQVLNITSNRFSGLLPTSLLNHPRWNEIVWGIVEQQPGYEFEREIVHAGEQEVTGIHGETIRLDSLFASQQLTVVLKWSDWDPFTGKFLPVLKSIYANFSKKGLGVISYARANNGNTEVLKNYIRDNQMTWTNVILENPEEKLGNFPNLTVPNVHVVNQEGIVVFSDQLWDNREAFEQFVTDRLGPLELYASKDYSLDGQVMALQKATTDKGVNIVLMGDGFVDTTMVSGGLYEKKMQEAMEHFFEVEPTRSYREYFNVYCVKAVSKNGVFTDRAETALNAEFGINRGITGDITRVKEYAAKVQGLDGKETHIITLMNSTGHAGMCYLFEDGSVSFISNPADTSVFAGVLQHEAIGHGLGKLGDEYIDHYESISQSEKEHLVGLQSKGWHLNLSLSPEKKPWDHFTGKPGYERVGAYEGGFYFWKGVWRPEETSSMVVSKLHYFNGPSREQIVKHILQAADQSYSWEEFVLKDKATPPLKSATVHTDRRQENQSPHQPPMVMKGRLFENN